MGDRMTAKPLGTGTVTAVPNGWYDITSYGATTGATDNTTAIQAAITAAKTSGGTVYVPPGQFKFASPLICDLPTKGFSITGSVTAPGHGVTPSELRYTGTTSPAISCHSVYGFALEGIKFSYTSASFTGDLIDIDGFPHAADCTNWRVSNCTSTNVGSITARSIIRLENAINGVIRDCGLAGAVNCIRMGNPGGGYVVGVEVDNCTFNQSSDTNHIMIGSNDAENIMVFDCRFEASAATGALRCATTAIDGADGNLYTFEFSNNWCGDASGAAPWLKDLRPISGAALYVCGNYFADTTGVHVGCDSTIGVVLSLIGNHFVGGSNVFTCNTNSMVTTIGNFVNNPTNICNSGGDGPFEWTSLANRSASGATVAKTMWNRLPDRVAFGTGKASGAFPGGSFDAGLTGLQESLVVGAISGSSRQVMGKKAAIYATTGGGDSGTHCLNIQAPTDDVARQVAIVAGTTPTVRLSADGTGLGLYTATPVAQPTRVGQLTDSTGGVVSGTLAAGITDANAKNAIASLCAKVNALETALHNLGVTA